MTKPESPVKAELLCLDLSDDKHKFKFQFNPTTFKFTRSVSWSDSNEAAAKQPWTFLEFTGGKADVLDISLILDEADVHEYYYEIPSVLSIIMVFYRLTMPLEFEKKDIRPPAVAFLWQQFQFQGVVEKMDVTMELFDSDGRPIRASVALTLKGRALAAAANADALLKGVYKAPKKSSNNFSAGGGNRLDILKGM